MNKKYLIKDYYSKLPDYHYEDNINGIINNPAAPVLRDYKIYGNSVQDGTPTPDTPIEIQSVGDLVTDTSSPYYGKYDAPMTVCGKNLFDKSISSQNGIKNETVLPNDKYGLGVLPINKICDILKPNTTYTISCEYECTAIPDEEYVWNNDILGFIIKPYLSGYSSIVIYITKHLSVGEIYQYSTTFTTPSKFDNGGNYELLCYMNRYINSDNKNNSATVIVRNLQIELGSTATDYELYSGETKHIYLDEPLRKIGNSSDYIDFVNKQVIRNIGAFDLNGDVVTYNLTINGRTRHGIRTSAPAFSQSIKVGTGMSNRESYFNQSTSNPHAIWTLDRYLYWVNILDFLGIYDSSKTNEAMIAEFKTWIENNPTYVYYILPNPLIEPIDLPDIELNNRLNNIMIETKISPSSINYQYYKK